VVVCRARRRCILVIILTQVWARGDDALRLVSLVLTKQPVELVTIEDESLT
jgi:hypothetical protein